MVILRQNQISTTTTSATARPLTTTKIKPKTFKWNIRDLSGENKENSKNGKLELGFIAQEIQEAMEPGENDLLNLVYDSNPDRLEIKPSNLIPIMVQSIKDLSNELKSVKSELKRVTNEYDAMRAKQYIDQL